MWSFGVMDSVGNVDRKNVMKFVIEESKMAQKDNNILPF